MARHIKILDRQFIPAGTTIIEQGDMGNRAFLIERGKVEVFVKDAKGNVVILGELGAGAMIGEMAVITGGKRSASVRAIEDSVLVTITARELRDSMGSESFFHRVMRMTRERMEDTSMKLMKKERKLATIEKKAPLNLKSATTSRSEAVSVNEDTVVVDKKMVSAGTTFIEQGTMGTTAFLIESGRVEVFVRDETGREVIITTLGPKSLVGEISLLANKPRSASVRALEDTVMIPVSADDLRDIVGTSEGLHKTMVNMMVNRVKGLHGKLLGRPMSADAETVVQTAIGNATQRSADAAKNAPQKGNAPGLDKLKDTLEKFTRE